MPIIQVNMLEGRSTEQKRRMISAVTQAVVESLGVKGESVRIMIHEMQPEHFAVNGHSAGEVPLKSRGNGNGAAATAGAPHAPAEAAS